MRNSQIESIFNAALQKASTVERVAFLEGACGNDADLRARVEALLRAHDEAGRFLEPTSGDASAEGPGTTIGRYKLLQLIGEGGFGAVYMAEQVEPVRRKVALKIIKLGMDTRPRFCATFTRHSRSGRRPPFSTSRTECMRSKGRMRKVLVIAARDYRAAVLSKAFIISLLALPIMWGGSAASQVFLKDKVDTADKRVAIVDRTGRLHDTLARAAQHRNETEIFSGEGTSRRQVKPQFLLEVVDPTGVGDIPQSTLKLSDRVRAKDLFAFLEIGPDLLDTAPAPERARITYHSDTPTYDDFVEWFEAVLNVQLQEFRFAQAGLDRDVVRRVIRTESAERLGLVTLGADGTISEAEEANKVANLLMPLAMMTLMWVAVMVGASPLLQSVLEEKMGRIAEVLLGSVTPFQFMLGKLVGTVGVSLTIVSIYMLAGYLALRHAGYGDFFPAHVLPWFLLYQALAVLMYGSIFAAIGAAVTDAQEAQSSLMPVMIVTMAPMFVFMNVLREPGSTMALAFSLFPPATPMLMILRQAVPPGIPIWQPLIGVALVLLTTTACVFAAGRIFRLGLLMQGKGADYRQMFRWVVSG
jgi:ABC-2 type transport system permease protein